MSESLSTRWHTLIDRLDDHAIVHVQASDLRLALAIIGTAKSSGDYDSWIAREVGLTDALKAAGEWSSDG